MLGTAFLVALGSGADLTNPMYVLKLGTVACIMGVLSAPRSPRADAPSDHWTRVLGNTLLLRAPLGAIGIGSGDGANVYLRPPEGGLAFGFWINLRSVPLEEDPLALLRLGPETAPAPGVSLAADHLAVSLTVRAGPAGPAGVATREARLPLGHRLPGAAVDKWSHVVVGLSGWHRPGRDPATLVTLWLNGSRVAATSVEGAAAPSSGPLFLVPEQPPAANEGSRLGDVAYLHRSPTTEDVEILYNRGQPAAAAFELGGPVG